VEEISTMVLPGWREELEQLRKQPSAPDLPVHTQEPAHPLSFLPQPPEISTPLPASAEREKPAAHAPLEHKSEAADAQQADSSRRERRRRIWEQESTHRYPQVQVEKQAQGEAGPAPAVEHPPFAATFEIEEEVESLTESTAIDWQVLSSPGAAPVSQTDDVEQEAEESDVEDLPTLPLAVPEAVKRRPAITIERASTPAPIARDVSQEEIEDLPTRPMPASTVAAPAPRAPLTPQPAAGGGEVPVALRQSSASPRPAPRQPAVSPGSQVHGPISNPVSQPGQVFNPPGLPAPQGPPSVSGNPLSPLPLPAAAQRPSAFAPPSPAAALPGLSEPHRRRVTPLRVALLVVLVLVVGVGAFVFYYQATSGGTVTQPYQAFQNSTLGVSLNYPQGWTLNLNQAQTRVHFADSSQTGQVTLDMRVPGAASLTQYLDQQITQLGIAMPQFAPTRLFGGVSWQQIQGDVVQQGVTYMLELYATQHGTHLYTLSFLAPPSAYGRIEQESFAPLRASLRFIQGQ
jgi:hypothetical protein